MIKTVIKNYDISDTYIFETVVINLKHENKLTV